MSKTFVCSVGTSAAKSIGPLEHLPGWVMAQGSVQGAAKGIFTTFEYTSPKAESLSRILSAEIYSLVRMGLTGRDRVLLLASDTDDGEACARAVELYLDQYWPDAAVEVKRIAGLQVDNPGAFRRQGVVEYCRCCLKAVNDFGADNVVLNPTGGFKALVAYTVLVGMLKRVPCRYIFEQSEALLDLPPLPVEFQRSTFESYRPLFEQMERDTSIPLTDWEQAIPFHERGLLEALVDSDGREVTLSGVGLLFLDEMRTPSLRVPFLSRQAWKDCFNNLAGLANCDPFRFLERVARSEEAFGLAEHINLGNGLRWLKPGRTTDRYLVSLEDWRLLVWRVIREDQKGPNYPNVVTIDPVRERSRFTPFTRMEYVE